MSDISLVTICWNSEKRLRRTVESVLSQTVLPREYLFVDGGSTDGTLELLVELCALLRAHGVSSRVLHQERRPGEAGIPSAWNQGIAETCGDIIGLLNSDDWYEPTALEMVAAQFASQPDAGAVSCAVRFVHPDGRAGKVMAFGGIRWLGWKMTLPHPGLFVKRVTYDVIGLYDTRYRISADYDFVWRCVRGGVVLAHTEQVATNMELGGLANSSRALARRETREIALSHVRFPLVPWCAWALRAILGR